MPTPQRVPVEKIIEYLLQQGIVLKVLIGEGAHTAQGGFSTTVYASPRDLAWYGTEGTIDIMMAQVTVGTHVVDIVKYNAANHNGMTYQQYIGMVTRPLPPTE